MRAPFIVCALVLVLTAPARATPADELDLAKIHFRAGDALYQLGNYSDALREFNAGYQLAPRPIFLLNIGQAQRKLNDTKGALESFSRYLDLTPADDPQRKEVESVVRLLRAERETAAQALAVPSAPAPPEPAAAPLVVRPRAAARPWVVPVAVTVSGAVVLGLAIGLGLHYGGNRFSCADTAGCLDLKGQ